MSINSSRLVDSYDLTRWGNKNILDHLEEKFLAAGWVVDKKVSEVFYDKGAGKLFPTLGYVLGDKSDSISGSAPQYRNSLIVTEGDTITSRRYYHHSTICANHTYGSFIATLDSNYLFNKNFILRVYAEGYTGYGHYQSIYSSTAQSTLNGTLEWQVSTPGHTGAWMEATINISSVAHKNLVSVGNIGSIYYNRLKLNEPDWENLGSKTKELYIHTVTTQGETLYLSIRYLYAIEERIEFYVNRAFDGALAVDRQPGRIVSSDNNTNEYFYIPTPSYHFPSSPTDISVIVDSNSFFISLYGDWCEKSYTSNFAFRYFYLGQVDKFFNFNGGAIVTGSFCNRYTVSTSALTAGNSNYYVLYEGTWYGKTIASSVSNKQGYIDLVTPSNYTTAGYHYLSGEIFVTQQVAGVNLGLSDNFEYKPIGTLHNFYKHYGVTPTLPMSLTINGDEFWSFPLDTNNRIAFKAVDNA